jgi:precorrin-6Y C5,15-methyltransferase (decarboxylating)
VCERLGEPEERVRRVAFADLPGVDADPLNVVLLLGAARPSLPVIPFIDDADFEKKVPRKGLLTKREVRTLSLGALGLRRGEVAWDIGAGSGAVSIELARLGASRVCAVEKNDDGCTIVRENVARFATPQVEVLHARAPEGLDGLPDPDRVFVGGTAGSMAPLLAGIVARLRPGGAVVVNVATIENLAEATEAAKRTGLPWECLQVAVARSSPILDLTRFEALNPVWIVTIRRPGGA